MAEFSAADPTTHRVSLASVDLSVVEGQVDLDSVDPGLRPAVELELRNIPALTQEGELTPLRDEAAPEETADEPEPDPTVVPEVVDSEGSDEDPEVDE